MKKIKIDAKSTEGAVLQMKSYLGGEITESYGEYILNFDSEVGRGCVKCLTFDWGVSLMEFDAVLLEDILFVNENKFYNPIHFSYCSKGQFNHRFSDQENYRTVEQYHSSIIVSSKKLKHYTVLPKGKHIVINNIRVIRQDFLKKSLNYVEQLNKNLHEIFIDEKSKKVFSFFSPIHLKMQDHLNSIKSTSSKGLTRILQIEGSVYQLLSMHIDIYESLQNGEYLPNHLQKDELKIIRSLATDIQKDPSRNYSLEKLSKESGLSQAKLQDGFKFLYARTVTEYIRHIRLEEALKLLKSSNLNISQIVYTIGFTSRSYFSKIFREKYGLTPHEFKQQNIVIVTNEI